MRRPRRFCRSLKAAIAALEEEYNKTWRTYVEVDNPPETLYHYCQRDAMHGILRSGKLRASDALEMKDQQEMVYSIAVVRKVIAETDGGRSKYMMQSVKPLEKVREVLRGWCTHIACLPANIDLPGQWRNYAGNGTGCAIGFDRTSLEKTCHALPKPLFSVPLFPLCYDRLRQEEMIRSFLNKTATIERVWDFRPRVLQEYYSHVLKYLLSLAMSIKDPVWQAEREWRLLVVQPHDQLGFRRSSRPDGVCCFELPICSSHTVREVVPGSCCDLEPEDLSQFLIQVGLPEVRVRRSSCAS